jgi:hypothetical protein
VKTSAVIRAVVAGMCAVACAEPGVARAGQPVTNGTDIAQFEVAVRPASAATRENPRPVSLAFALRHTSASGGPATRLRTGALHLPSGMDVNLEPKPTCRLSALLLHGVRGCATRAQVGAGTAVLDGRPAGRGYPLRAKVRVFSALVDVPPPPPGFRVRPALIIYAFAPGADVFLPFGHPPSRPNWLGIGPGPTTIPLGINIEDLRVTLRAIRWPKAEGGKPLVQAPTRCTGAWHFSADVALAIGGLVATDDVPCRRAG